MARISVQLAVVCFFSSFASVFGQESPTAKPTVPEPVPTRLPVPTLEKLQEFERRSRDMALASRVTFANPPEIRSGRGILQTTLIANYGYNRIGNDEVYLRSYNGFLTGPTLRVRPNDRLSIRLLNDLPAEAAPSVHDVKQAPHGTNTTNLHVHGLHVSPEDNGDNPLLEVAPNGRHDYEFRLGSTNAPAFDVREHPPGTHWYHPHKHGAAALQLASGMAGAIIVEGGLDDIPRIAAARERIFVLQQIPYSDSVPGTLEGKAGFMRVRDWSRLIDRYTTINGLLKPVIEMALQEVERWRFVHAGLSARLNLALKPVVQGNRGIDFHEIAVDGIALGKIAKQSELELTTGGTSDALIKAPDQPGEYLLVKLDDPLARLTPKGGVATGTPEDALAHVIVRGPANAMDLPSPESLAGLAPYPEIGPTEKKREFTLDGEGGDSPKWLVNGKQFNPARTDLSPVVGTSEEWTVKSLNQAHPFHIHVNAFQVLSIKDGTGQETLRSPGIWRDTVLLEESETMRLRIRFEDFPGKTVLHCHKLDHEDDGMMQLVRILPELSGEPVALRAEGNQLGDQPAQSAPPWRLLDAQGSVHDFREFGGKRLLLVFYRGMGCPHCVEQLRELGSRRKALDAGGVVVVAVSSEPLALPTATPGNEADLPFLILADDAHQVFKQYGCYQGGPMHGVFVIDARGQIRWRSVSEAPFTDFDRLLQVVSELP